jgi:hypothetical protein
LPLTPYDDNRLNIPLLGNGATVLWVRSLKARRRAGVRAPQPSTSGATTGELPHRICGARICDPSSPAFLPTSLVGCCLSHPELVLLSHLHILSSLWLAPLHTAIWRGNFSPDRGGSTSTPELCTGLLRRRLTPRRLWPPPILPCRVAGGPARAAPAVVAARAAGECCAGCGRRQSRRAGLPAGHVGRGIPCQFF